MLDANELLQKGLEQVKSAGITPGSINPNIIINTRAQKRFGFCQRTVGPYDYQIQLNEALLHTEEKKAMNTMVHEILHTCKGCMNHGKLWKIYADMMNKKFGYDISRTSSFEKVGIARPESKYVIECTKCDNVIHRTRKCKLTENVGRYRCGACRGKLKMK